MDKNNRWISGPLMREGLKQFWFIPVMIFIAYFMSGIFPLILAGLGTYGGNFAREALQNDNLGFLFNIGGASIILGCMATRMWLFLTLISGMAAPTFRVLPAPIWQTMHHWLGTTCSATVRSRTLPIGRLPT